MTTADRIHQIGEVARQIEREALEARRIRADEQRSSQIREARRTYRDAETMLRSAGGILIAGVSGFSLGAILQSPAVEAFGAFLLIAAGASGAIGWLLQRRANRLMP